MDFIKLRIWTDACGGKEVALQINITATWGKKEKQAALYPRRKFLTIFKGHSSRYFPKGWKNPRREAIISFQMIPSSVADLLSACFASICHIQSSAADSDAAAASVFSSACGPHGRGEASSPAPRCSRPRAPLLALTFPQR